MKLAYKSLAVQKKINTEEARRILEATRRLDSQLKAIDASVGDFRKNVGDYFNSFSNSIQQSIVKTVDLSKGFESVAAVAASSFTSIIQNVIEARSRTELYINTVNTLKGALAGLAVAFLTDVFNKIVKYFEYSSYETEQMFLNIKKVYEINQMLLDVKSKNLDAAEEERIITEKYKNSQISIFEYEKQMLNMNNYKLKLLREEYDLREKMYKIQLQDLERQLKEKESEYDAEAVKNLREEINNLMLRRREESLQYRQSIAELEQQRKNISNFVEQELKRIAELRQKVFDFLAKSDNAFVENIRKLQNYKNEIRSSFEESLKYLSICRAETF